MQHLRQVSVINAALSQRMPFASCFLFPLFMRLVLFIFPTINHNLFTRHLYLLFLFTFYKSVMQLFNSILYFLNYCMQAFAVICLMSNTKLYTIDLTQLRKYQYDVFDYNNLQNKSKVKSEISNFHSYNPNNNARYLVFIVLSLLLFYRFYCFINLLMISE